MLTGVRTEKEGGGLQTEADWVCIPTFVRKGASVGTSATILAGVTVGEKGIVGAGSVVTQDVPAGTIVAGNPARILRKITEERKNMKVPFLDLKAQYESIRGEIAEAIRQVLERTAFAGGPFVWRSSSRSSPRSAERSRAWGWGAGRTRSGWRCWAWA